MPQPKCTNVVCSLRYRYLSIPKRMVDYGGVKLLTDVTVCCRSL